MILLFYFLKHIIMIRGVYEESTDKEESTDQKESVDLSDMSPLESDEEEKEGKRLKTLTQKNF